MVAVLLFLRRMTTQLCPKYFQQLFPSNAYLCRQCVRAVEKLVKTRESVQRQQNELKEKIVCACVRKGLDLTYSGRGERT